MGIKKKSLLIIILSSLVISSVMALTLFGYYAHLEWKEKGARRNYRRAVYEMNAKLYGKNVSISLQAKIDRGDNFKDKPIVEGAIKNNTGKKISALKLKIAFYDNAQRVVYADSFYPVGSRFERIVELGDTTESFLEEGDSLSFTHLLRNCPPKVIAYLKSKLKFAKDTGPRPFKLKLDIEEMDIR